MIKVDDIRKFNMYLIPLFFGMIVFMQIDLFPTGTGQVAVYQAIALNFFTAVLFNMTTLLFVATIPKKNKLLVFINWAFKKKWDQETIDNKAKIIDTDISFFVYYLFAGLMIVFSIASIIIFYF